MIDISILRAMSESGASQETILAAIEADQKLELEKLAAKREKNRIRVRNQRSRARSAAHTEAQSGTPLAPSSSSPPHPPNNYTPDPPPSLRSGLRTRGSRLPADWLPSESDLAFAEPLLGPRVREEDAKFRDYWAARADAGAVKLDWSATWRNWCRKAANDHPARAGPAFRKPTLVEVADDLLAKMRAFDEPAPRIRDGASEGIIRRLPSK